MYVEATSWILICGMKADHDLHHSALGNMWCVILAHESYGSVVAAPEITSWPESMPAGTLQQDP